MVSIAWVLLLLESNRLIPCSLLTTTGKDLEAVLVQVEKMWRKLDLSWTPKFHGLREHSVDQLMASKGFMEMQEDWVEHGHQSGNRDMNIYKSVKDYGKRSASMAMAESVRNNNMVQAKVEEVQQATRRKRRRMGPSPAEERKLQANVVKAELRQEAVSKIISPTKMLSGYDRQKELMMGSGIGEADNGEADNGSTTRETRL
jgi:hypothetical protein